MKDTSVLWVINVFESGIFPMASVNDVGDDNDHYICDDELYSKGNLTPKTSATAVVDYRATWRTFKPKPKK